MLKVNNKEARTMSTLSLLLTLSLTRRSTYPGVFIINFEHISHLADVKYAKIRALYWKKERKVIGLQIAN